MYKYHIVVKCALRYLESVLCVFSRLCASGVLDCYYCY